MECDKKNRNRKKKFEKNKNRTNEPERLNRCVVSLGFEPFTIDNPTHYSHNSLLVMTVLHSVFSVLKTIVSLEDKERVLFCCCVSFAYKNLLVK